MNIITPKIVTELHGNWPVDEFKELESNIFYREIHQEFGTSIWIPRDSVMDCQNSSLMTLPIFQNLIEIFTKYPEFDSITLSNI